MAAKKQRCYIAIPHLPGSERVKDAITAGVHQAGFQIAKARSGQRSLTHSMRESIIGELANADCIIAEISENDPNVFYAIGLAQAMGKEVFLLANDTLSHDIPSDVQEYHIQLYSRDPDGFASLIKKISKLLTEFRLFPRRKAALRGSSSAPFFVDWDKLSPTDTDNLCKELLTQMGFKRIDWQNDSPEVDMIAELPKKDPDGFEYKELWLISMGNIPTDNLMEMALHDPAYLIHWLSRHSDEARGKSHLQSAATFTVLLISPRNSAQSDEFAQYSENWRRRARRNPMSTNARLRVWDQSYLTSLIHQFPQIGYKYFSDEGRLRSETRKSYEDLYNENSGMVIRLTSLVLELEEEKRRRASAERDAVWKDISFAAAHKIGNPIFAIETDLDPLEKRIMEERITEAMEVVDNIRSAVEKAKSFVEQFKSLAKAQQIKLAHISLRMILTQAVRTVCNQNIHCEINCPPETFVLGDLERLSECFDELVANSVHWFDKEEKNIVINVSCPKAESLPSILDSNKQYVLVHFLDNGVGIPVAEKSRIFDAFFTTHEHGTGLGLALVRRIIEGHAGIILESGVPGKGADFEIYLPAADSIAQLVDQRTKR